MEEDAIRHKEEMDAELIIEEYRCAWELLAYGAEGLLPK